VSDGGELVPLHTSFDVVFRGYRRGPVREYVRSVEAELRLLAADRDANASLAQDLAAEVEQLRVENGRLRHRLDEMARTPVEPAALPERLRRMVELANEEAGEIIARAQGAAEHCWATAQEAAGRLRARYEESITEVDRTRRAMTAEHQMLLQQARADATTMTTEADRRRKELDDQAARRRERIRTDFEVAMSARRTEAMRAIAEQRASARAEANRLVTEAKDDATTRVRTATDEAASRVHTATEEATSRVRAAKEEAASRVKVATDEATRLVSEAQAEVTRLQDLRTRLATQLRNAREVLTGAGPLLTPLAAEEDLLSDPPRPAKIPRQRKRHNPHADDPSADLPLPDKAAGEPVPAGPAPADQEAG
jgi:cell division septum initiation protein DivIVA